MVPSLKALISVNPTVRNASVPYPALVSFGKINRNGNNIFQAYFTEAPLTSETATLL